MKRPPASSGILLVAIRELRWFRRDRVAAFLVVGVPLIAFAILTATFSNAVIRDLGVLVVDADRSATSLRFAQMIDAAPGVRVTGRANDLAEATRAVKSGEALAAAYIPANLERELMAGRRPQIEVFYNTQFMTPGNTAGKAIGDALKSAAAAVAPARAFDRSPKIIGQLLVEQYVLSNPAFNYAQFLVRAVLPTVLHVVMTIGASYAVGSEFSRRNRRAWLRCAGGSPLVALLGKLAPLFVAFLVQMMVIAAIMHGVLGVPFQGDAVIVGAAACLLALAYLSLGALLPLLVRNLPLGLSLAGLIVSPAFGYAGVGFPVAAMEAFPRIWGGFLPLRWYIQILFDQAARAAPISVSAEPFAILAILATALFGLSWLRLRAIAAMPSHTHPDPPFIVMPSTVGGAFLGEWRRVLADRNVKGLFIIAPLLYGAYYPQPYLGELVRDAPIAVVDHDRSALSLRLIQTLDAHEAVKIGVRAETLAEAQQALFDRRVFAILDIPENLEREVLKGNDARLPGYVDSTYFMLFNRTLLGVGEAAAIVTAELQSRGARMDGGSYRAALATANPVEIVMEPLFNPTGGYGSYIVPAAFVLILQQTLLMGAAMLSVTASASGGAERRSTSQAARMVLGRATAHVTLYIAPTALLLIVLPHVYGFSTLGRTFDLALFAAPFILATSLLGQTAGRCFRRRETAVVLFIATSLPQFFLVGVSWPVEAIPLALRSLGRIFPSEAAIDGLVRIGQMGARLSDVATGWGALWGLVGVYFLLAVLATRLTSEGRRHVS